MWGAGVGGGEAMVMGGHGDTMVPLPGFTKISGKPLLDLVKEGKITSERVRPQYVFNCPGTDIIIEFHIH